MFAASCLGSRGPAAAVHGADTPCGDVMVAPLPLPEAAASLASEYPVAHSRAMVEVRQTEVYARWFGRIRDRRARVRVHNRIGRLGMGSPGDLRPAREGVPEIRIGCGPGCRLYFAQRGEVLVILPAAVDKDGRQRDV